MEWLDSGVEARPRELPMSGFSRVIDAADNGVLLFDVVGAASGPQATAYIWRRQDARPVRIAEGFSLGLSRDGATALIGTVDKGVNQYWLVPTGVGQRRAVDVGSIEFLYEAAWHPDGRLILDLERAGAAAAIYGFSATGTGPSELLPESFRLTGTRAASPDGTRLSVRVADGHLESCVLATAVCHPVPGSSEEDLVAGWHTDNRSLFVYQRYRVPVEVVLLHTDTGRRTPFKVLRTLRPLLTSPRSAIRRPPQLGHSARRLHEKATRRSNPQPPQRKRASVCIARPTSGRKPRSDRVQGQRGPAGAHAADERAGPGGKCRDPRDRSGARRKYREHERAASTHSCRARGTTGRHSRRPGRAHHA
jgi:hypothetical protein